MRRIVVYNPHNELWFGKSLLFWLYRRPWVPKYAFIVRQVLVDCGVFYALAPQSCNTGGAIRKAIEFIKFKCWALANGYNPLKCKLLFSPECVTENDFLLVIYVGNFTSFSGEVVSKSLATYLNRSKGRIVLNMNHYPYHPSSGSQSIRLLNFHYFWAESDLRKNSGYFRKHFGDFNQAFIVAPFAVRSKFTCTTKFNLRLVKAVAVGSVSLKMTNDRDFVDYFGHDDLQPIRNELYNGIPDEFKNIVASNVSHINEGGATRPVRAAPNIVSAITNWMHNVFIYGQHKYHSLDMCDIFNIFSIHIVGEEVVGMPGIGFAEGMMCGSVFIGLDDPMYTDLGMIPGKHYLTYDGTYSSLLETVRDSLESSETLVKISESGCLFARNNFTESIVYESFKRQMS